MNKLLKEIENYMNRDTISYMIAKQLISKGHDTKSFTQLTKNESFSQVYRLRLWNAISDIEKGYKKLENIPDIKLDNL